MTKWTTADIPDQTGRIAIITGANTGLGFETAAALAARAPRSCSPSATWTRAEAAADRIDQAAPRRRRRRPGARPGSLESVRDGRRRAARRSTSASTC